MNTDADNALLRDLEAALMPGGVIDAELVKRAHKRLTEVLEHKHDFFLQIVNLMDQVDILQYRLEKNTM